MSAGGGHGFFEDAVLASEGRRWPPPPPRKDRASDTPAAAAFLRRRSRRRARAAAAAFCLHCRGRLVVRDSVSAFERCERWRRVRCVVFFVVRWADDPRLVWPASPLPTERSGWVVVGVEVVGVEVVGVDDVAVSVGVGVEAVAVSVGVAVDVVAASVGVEAVVEAVVEAGSCASTGSTTPPKVAVNAVVATRTISFARAVMGTGSPFRR